MAAMANFAPGKIVQLKSGGPLMTVTEVKSGDVTCIWFSEQAGDIRKAVVPAAALDEVDLADDEDDDDFEDD
jgi:uncharacterized protein YodC (DUF2158 family)